MSFLAQVLAYVLQKLLEKGGKALYEWTHDFVEKKKQERKEKENLVEYHEAVKSKDKEKILDAETNLLNGE